MDAAFKWLMAFVASQLMIMALGMLPKHFWRSFRPPPPGPKVGGRPEPVILTEVRV
jgi:hypothetical protein